MDPTPAAAPRPWIRFLPPALIAAVTAAAFLPSLRGEFLNWDDDANFTLNPHYRGFSAETLRWMFTNAFGHYMPITWLTLALDYSLWGMNPVGYHATSMGLHALNAVLCFFVLRILVNRAAPDLDPLKTIGAAAAGALFFSIHPLRAESVAWITERRDVVAGVFFFLTLLAYLKQRVRLSVAAFAAMLLCKSMAMTLPLVLLVLDAVPLRRFAAERPAKLLIEKIPFFVLMIAAVVATSLTQSHAEAMYTRDAYPLVQSVAQPGYRISFYVLKTLAPFNLSPLYWYRPDIGLPQVLGWIAVVGVSILAFVGRRAAPAAGAAWISYLLLIAPVAGIFQAGPHFAADRYTYFAGVPFAALAAAALPRRPAAFAIAGILIAGLAVLTAFQSRIWTDSVSLWTRAITLDPDVYFTHQRRGAAFAARSEWDRALRDYDRSIELNPYWFESRQSRARARIVRGDHGGALEDADHAIRLQRDSAEAWLLRGQACGKLRQSDSALAALSRALELRPNFVEARLERASERALRGDADGALQDLDAAIAFDPQPSIFRRRGMTRAMKKDLRGAVADFEQALERAPADWSQRRQVEEFLRQAREELPR